METPRTADVFKWNPFGGKVTLTADDCQHLSSTSPETKLPKECESILAKAKKTVSMPASQPQSQSRVQQTWTASDSHSKRSFDFFDVSHPDKANSPVDTEYLNSQHPEAQDKIRRLRTRMSARGALNVTGVDQNAVDEERMKALAKKQSRRDEFRKPPTPTKV